MKKSDNITINIPKVLHVKVTEEDIKNGKMKSDTNCPIAIATRRIGDHPNVNQAKIELVVASLPPYLLDDCDGLVVAIYTTPKKAARFIDMFDEGSANLKPFEFNAKLESIRL